METSCLVPWWLAKSHVIVFCHGQSPGCASSHGNFVSRFHQFRTEKILRRSVPHRAGPPIARAHLTQGEQSRIKARGKEIYKQGKAAQKLRKVACMCAGRKIKNNLDHLHSYEVAGSHGPQSSSKEILAGQSVRELPKVRPAVGSSIVLETRSERLSEQECSRTDIEGLVVDPSQQHLPCVCRKRSRCRCCCCRRLLLLLLQEEGTSSSGEATLRLHGALKASILPSDPGAPSWQGTIVLQFNPLFFDRLVSTHNNGNVLSTMIFSCKYWWFILNISKIIHPWFPQRSLLFSTEG